MKSKVPKYIRDAKKAIAHMRSMGMTVTGIAISCSKELTPDEAKALEVIAKEVHQNSDIPDISIDNFNK